MNDRPGRRIFHWGGLDRRSDIEAMTAAVAETVSGLCSRDGQIARLNEDGSLDSINLIGLQGLIGQHLCGMRVVRGHNGAGFKREFFTFSFEPTPHQGPPTQATGLRGENRSNGPDAAVLREIFDRLPGRLPRVVE